MCQLKSNYKLSSLRILLSILSSFFLSSGSTAAQTPFTITPADITDCAACQRINLFIKSKELISINIWNGLNTKTHTRPLLYFTGSNTYVAFGSEELFKKYNYRLLKCENGLLLLKLARMDTVPFHMENKMNFTDSTSLYYNQPMMLCSDVETLIKMVPDFEKTEDWLQLVMHEYFHSFQFSHKATLNYLADSVHVYADTLDKIYLQNPWFRHSLEIENAALLNALRVIENDSIKFYIDEFFTIRHQRRMEYENLHKLNLSVVENFWETIEGTARYAEYYMAGYFNQMKSEIPTQCDNLFRNFTDYADQLHFETKHEFIARTKMMQAYYYVTGFNLCRLMDKMDIKYKQDLFNNPSEGLYVIFTRSFSR